MQSLIENFDSLTLRERSLVFVSVFALIFMIWNISFMGGLHKREKNVKKQKTSFEQQIVILEEQIKKSQGSIVPKEKKDPVAINKVELLQKKIDALDQQKKGLILGSLKPKNITGVLKSVLMNIKGLKVVRMNVLDATPLDQEAVTDITGYLYSKISQPYKHEIEVELYGNYFSIYTYLKKLESMDKVFYWNEITYKALAWPNAHIILKAYTISLKVDDSNA